MRFMDWLPGLQHSKSSFFDRAVFGLLASPPPEGLLLSSRAAYGRSRTGTSWLFALPVFAGRPVCSWSFHLALIAPSTRAGTCPFRATTVRIIVLRTATASYVLRTPACPTIHLEGWRW